ncbi:MAG TPA: ABC transporter ATP-binding protein [Candidatus Hydrogenedentes bacterium]|nr:ABC transporter ATP-binding protein [Candidatus Hydrogenedentota bacterium]
MIDAVREQPGMRDAAQDGDGGEALLSLRGVSLAYWLKKGFLRRKKLYALRDVSFDLRRGDSLGVIGRNGSGKSTLLRLIAGVMTPDGGEIVKRPGLRVSLLSLQLGFIDYLTGRENAILSGMFLGMSKREILDRIDPIIEFAELGEFIDQPLASYSSGMRARLGFAVAFQLDPDILLIDEVLGVGDAEFQERSFSVLKERVRSADSTVVFVSHSANNVRGLCNRAVWLDEGQVRAAGDSGDVLRAYEDSITTKHFEDVKSRVEGQLRTFVRVAGEQTVYVVEQGRFQPLKSWNEFVSVRGRPEDIRVLEREQFEKLRKAVERNTAS